MLRWTVPWIALGALTMAVLSLTGNFREAAAEREAELLVTGTVNATSSVGATATADKPKTEEAAKPADQPAQPPAAAPSAPSQTVIAVAMVEGILLRREASSSGEVIDRLKNGTEMVVLEQTDAWLKIKDPQGRIGWIRNNQNLISLKQTP